MNKSITKRLILYNTIILLFFAFIVSILFYFSYSKSTLDIYKNNLSLQAENISDTLSVNTDINTNFNGRNNQNTMNSNTVFGQYINMIDDVSTADVWIVDENAQTITKNNRNLTSSDINYKELPEDSLELIEAVYNGDTITKENSNFLFDEPTITVGTPIYDSDKQIIAALLLHMNISTINDSIYSGLKLLIIIIGLALIITITLSIFFARSFTLPLKKITNTTKTIANGNYLVKTNVDNKDEIGELANNIDILSTKLEQARLDGLASEQLRKDYISNISHELRTPVTIIRGSLEAITDKVVTDEVKVEQYHREMLNESIHLENMVNDLLELSRLQNPKYIIDKSEINIIDCLKDAVSASEKLSKNKKVSIELSTDLEFYKYNGDYTRLRQLFLIILSNAIKFSKNDSKVEINVNEQNIIIKDYGRGIAEQDLNNIFNRFYKTNIDNPNGTGLGLAIANEIATRHNIKLTVKSKVNEFTEFTIKL
jgi:signal transduction histidine kinase